MANLVLVQFHLEEGCSQEDHEVSIAWSPINFMIFSELFPDMVYTAAEEFLSENTIKSGQVVEVVMRHVIDRDGAGAVCGEWFEPIIQEVTYQ